MAKRVTVVLVDDINEEPADQTITFSLDGTTYEIDLTNANATKFRKMLSTWTKHARTTSKRSKKAPAATKKAPEKVPSHEVRAWAKANGYEIAPRGPIPREVKEAYAARDLSRIA